MRTHNAGNYNDHLKVPQARTVRLHKHISSAAAGGVEAVFVATSASV